MSEEKCIPSAKDIAFLSGMLSHIPDMKPDSEAWREATKEFSPFLDDVARLTSDQAAALVQLAISDPIAHENLKLIILNQLYNLKPLPPAFSIAAAYMILGTKPVRGKGRAKSDNASRDEAIAWAIYWLWERHGIRPTRGIDKKEDPDAEGSGCAIVSWIVNRDVRLNLTEDAVEKVWSKSAFRRRWKELH